MTPYLKILKNFSKPHWFEIIYLIKSSQGMSVGELSEAMGMSYMGVKKHCIAMQRLGYLDTWRRPKDVGRPEKLYRITQKLDPLFPGIEDGVTLSLLDAAAQLDRNAAEKLLFAFFRDQTEKFAKVVTGNSVQERAERLADARLKMGYFSKCTYSEEEGLQIVEFHNPLRSLFEKYSTMERIEVQMFERLLGARVARSEDSSSGLNRYRFDLSPR
ncbi:MAG: helix-turn-helix transcriptional regulator [Verrucomicrobiales bacterium]